MIFAPGLLAGQTAIVTGGGTGIGRGIALELARAGANIVLAGRRPQPLAEVAAEIEAIGPVALAVPTDVRDWDQVQALVATATERFGGVDILINNAGGQFGAPFEKLSPNGWKSVIDLDLNGIFHCTRAVADGMIARRRGKVVSIITGMGRRAAPNVAHSGAARAGVENLTRSVALEWAKYNIQVNCLSPIVFTEGFVANSFGGSAEAEERFLNWVPARRPASLEEIGWLVVYLCSRAGDYITGEHIAIDGGYWLSVGFATASAASAASAR